MKLNLSFIDFQKVVCVWIKDLNPQSLVSWPVFWIEYLFFYFFFNWALKIYCVLCWGDSLSTFLYYRGELEFPLLGLYNWVMFIDKLNFLEVGLTKYNGPLYSPNHFNNNPCEQGTKKFGCICKKNGCGLKVCLFLFFMFSILHRTFDGEVILWAKIFMVYWYDLHIFQMLR